MFASRGGYRVDADQELLASGVANLGSGLFGGIGVAGSLSKTAAVCDARRRTQMAGITAAVLSQLVILAVAPALSDLPKAVLSAIVVNAVWKLMDVAAIRRYARVRRDDIVAAAVAAVGVLAFGPMYGLLLAVAGSVLGLVYRSSRVDVEVMGKVPHEKAAWGGTRNHDERRTFPGVLVLRVDAPIFWVTAAPIMRGGTTRNHLRRSETIHSQMPMAISSTDSCARQYRVLVLHRGTRRTPWHRPLFAAPVRTAQPPQGPPFVRLSARKTIYSATDVDQWLRTRCTDPSTAA